MFGRFRRAMIPVLFIGLATLAGPSGVRAEISDVWYNTTTGHWYKYYATNASGVTWKTAKARAEALGGYLATVNSASENAWLVSTRIAAGRMAFIGGTDEGTEGIWRWITGEPFSYTNWAPGKPGGSTPYDFLRLESNGQWVNVNGVGTQATGYIVEWNQDPNGSTKPPPPPPGSACDLSVESVRFTPAEPLPGDTVEVDFRVRNAGPGSSGNIRATLDLAGYQRPEEEGPLAKMTIPGLGKGSSTSRTMEFRLSRDIPSGEYTMRVIVVPSDGPSDRLIWNNSAAAPKPLIVEQSAIELVPGPKTKHQIGPLGRQEFRLDALEGLKGRLRAKFLKAEGPKWLCRDGESGPFLEVDGKGALTYRLTGESAESLVLGIECAQRTGLYYTVELKGKVFREGELDIPAGGIDLLVPGYRGMVAAVSVKQLEGGPPRLTVDDLGERGRLKSTKKGAKLRRWVLDGTGPWIVRVAGEGDVPGRCSWKIKVK